MSWNGPTGMCIVAAGEDQKKYHLDRWKSPEMTIQWEYVLWMSGSVHYVSTV